MKYLNLGVAVVALVIATIALLNGASFAPGAGGISTTQGGWTVNEDGTSEDDFRAEGDTLTHLLFADASADRVGISSSTPTGLLSVGSAGATSTIAAGRFCLLASDSAGRTMYVTLSTSGNTQFSTSTTPCN